jgi:hypothetical protein
MATKVTVKSGFDKGAISPKPSKTFQNLGVGNLHFTHDLCPHPKSAAKSGLRSAILSGSIPQPEWGFAPELKAVPVLGSKEAQGTA